MGQRGLTRHLPLRDLDFEKVSNPRILAIPADFKTPLNLTLTYPQQLDLSFVNAYNTFYPTLNSTRLFLQLSVYPNSHMTPSHFLPCNRPPLCYPTDHLYPIPNASNLLHSEIYVFLHFRKKNWTF